MLKVITLILSHKNNGHVEVLYAEHSDMIEKFCNLVLNKFAPITKIYID
jgi:hypothetical protein